MEIWRKILTKIYLLLRPEFLMIGKSKESKEGNSYYLDCFEKESQKGIGTLAWWSSYLYQSFVTWLLQTAV